MTSAQLPWIRVGAAALLLGSCTTDAPAEDPLPDGSSSTSSAGIGGGGGSGGWLGGEGGAASPAASSSSAASVGSGGLPSDTPYPVPDWSVGAPEEHGLDAAKLDAAAAVAEAKGSYCLLVIRHGIVVAEHYWGGHDAHTPEKSWSIAKSYTSALVGIAIEHGDIGSLDDNVADYVPEWQGTDREAITVRHLLSMTSGLEWSVFGDYIGMAALSQDHTATALELEADAAPGAEWIYNNGAVQIFEPLFRNATGKTIEQYAAQNLWSKIGMTGTTWAHDPAGNPTAYASVMASCRDHARMGYLYLRGGAWAGETIVPAEHVSTTLTPSQDYNRAYGWLWWLNGDKPAINAMGGAYDDILVPFAPHDLFAMRGFGNQFVDVIPSLDMVVVRFGPDPMGSFDLAALATDQTFEIHDEILEPVLAAVVE